MDVIKVAIVDDHPVVLSGIRDLLQGAEDIAVVGEADTGTRALELGRGYDLDVLVLDMNLPDISGAEVAKRLASEGARVRVLGLSAYDDDEYIEDMLDARAAGYLHKREALGQIVEAIRGVAQGDEPFFSRSVTAKVIRARRGPAPATPSGPKGISPREREILELVARGQDQAEIADALSIAAGTVKNKVTELYRKSGAGSMQKLMLWAQQHGYGQSKPVGT